MMRMTSLVFIAITATPVAAQQACVGIADDALRLSCFDQAFGGNNRIERRTEEPSPPETEAGSLSAFSTAVTEKAALDLIRLVGTLETIDDLPDEMRSAAIEVISDYVRPLAVSDAAANLAGYSALATLDPGNETYAEREARYAAAVEERKSSVLGRMRTQSDAFTGTVFYEHPETPLLPETRSYLAVYAAQNGERVWLRMRLNYTNASWLFVESAALNIDGETIPLPYVDLDWNRDNTSKTWEWIDVDVDADLRDILRKIASAKTTVIRFNGRKYHDTVTLSEADKQVIRDMFLLEDTLRNLPG